jgi:hypothetical protein
LAIDRECANKRVVLAERHYEAGARATEIDHGAVSGVGAAPICLVVFHVDELHKPFAAQHPLLTSARTGFKGRCRHIFNITSGQPPLRGNVELAAVIGQQVAEGGIA